MRVAPTAAAAAALALLVASAAQASSLTLRPAAAPTGARIAVAGSGFRPGAQVPLRLAGRTLAFGEVDGTGRFSTTVSVPIGLRPRSRFLTAWSGRLVVRAQLQILDRLPASAPSEVATGGGLRLRLSSTLARPGETVSVSGAGLRPGAFARVALTAPVPPPGLSAGGGTGGPPPPVRVRASRSGRFTAVLAVPPTARPGGRASVTARAGRTALRLPLDLAPPGTAVPAPPLRRPEPLVAAAGDIACRPGQERADLTCHQDATAELLAGSDPDVVAALGDLQYERATLEEFPAFDASWGRLKDRIRPAVGNHEYFTPGAGPYYQYFGPAAGDPSRGYYSYDLASWHVVVLNSNCELVPCYPGSDQERWLRADLAAHPSRCTLAYAHHPRWTSGRLTGADESVSALWNALYDNGADVVLVGHDHFYERLAPLNDLGEIDRARGVRQFIVGTGGRGFSPYRDTAPGTEAADGKTFGILLLSLRFGGYSWFFAPDSASGFRDTGGDRCR